MSTNYGNQFDRYYVALGLPVKEDCYTIDYEAYRELIRYFLTDDFVQMGGSIIVNPEAGEIFTMSRDEKKKLLSIAVEEAQGKVPLFCGISNADGSKVGQDAKDAMAEGAAGLFVMPPIGCLDVTLGWDVRAFPEVFGNVFSRIEDAVGDVPFIAHGAGPKDPVYGLSYPIEVVDWLLEKHPTIIGWKMMYNFKALKDVAFFLRAREKKGLGHVGILQSSAHHYLESYEYGILDGTVSCFWNYSKEPNIKFFNALKEGRTEDAKKIWIEGGLFNLHNMVGKSHARLHTTFKVSAWLRGLYPTPYLRPPMIAPLKSELINLRKALIDAGLNVISDEEFNKVYDVLPR